MLRFASNDYVFPAARGGGHIVNMSLPTVSFDAKLPKGFELWRLNDLRRSCRTGGHGRFWAWVALQPPFRAPCCPASTEPRTDDG